MNKNNSLKSDHAITDLTNERLVFNEDWDCRLTRLAIYGIGLEELISLYDQKAARLRDMLDTGAVEITGDFPEWDECPSPTEPIMLLTYDPRVAAQFKFSEVFWPSREQHFDVFWKENGATIFVGDDADEITVKLW